MSKVEKAYIQSLIALLAIILGPHSTKQSSFIPTSIELRLEHRKSWKWVTTFLLAMGSDFTSAEHASGSLRAKERECEPAYNCVSSSGGSDRFTSKLELWSQRRMTGISLLHIHRRSRCRYRQSVKRGSPFDGVASSLDFSGNCSDLPRLYRRFLWPC